MKRIFASFSYAIALLFVLATQWAVAANDRAPFWAFKSDSATVYLLGSIHFADASFYPLRTEIEQAFKDSDYLAVEADILNVDMAAVQQYIQSRGMYAGNESLRDHVSDKTWQALQTYIETSGLPVPVQFFAKQKPALVAMAISSFMLQQHGLSPQLGIDIHFLKQAANTGKPILELEGMEQQLEMLLSLDDPDLFLQKSLEDADKVGEMIEQMVAAWKSGDGEALNQMMIEQPIADEPKMERLMEQLDFERNRQMVKKIEGYLQKGGTYFVVVGAAHLVGDKGIPSLMEQQGTVFEQQ